MNEKQQFEASSLEEVLSKACEAFSVSQDEIEYSVIEEKKGILGIGSKVVIEASKKEIEVPTEPVSITKEADEIEDKPVLVEAESEEDVFFKAAKEFLENTIAKMNIKATLIQDTVNEDVIVFNIVGEDIAILIGKYGATLDSLQYLACIVANKKFPCRRRIVLDADGHRAKRTKDLENRAIKIAEMVVKHGREAVMEPQNAKDRRIVHMALRNFEGVKTYSEGDGIERHVIISPVDK